MEKIIHFLYGQRSISARIVFSFLLYASYLGKPLRCKGPFCRLDNMERSSLNTGNLSQFIWEPTHFGPHPVSGPPVPVSPNFEFPKMSIYYWINDK